MTTSVLRTVTVRSFPNYRVEITARGHTFVGGEPPPEGDDAGPTAFEFLLAALGSCTVNTLLMYARRKGWPVESVVAHLAFERLLSGEGKREETIHVEVQVRGDLTEEQRARLLEIMQRCPVHRTLATPPRIEETLTVTP